MSLDPPKYLIFSAIAVGFTFCKIYDLNGKDVTVKDDGFYGAWGCEEIDDIFNNDENDEVVHYLILSKIIFF